MSSQGPCHRDNVHHPCSQGQQQAMQGAQQQQPGPPPPLPDFNTFLNGYNETKRYTVMNLIGKGSYGVVCSAKDNLTGQVVAIKKIQNVFDNVADAHRILREITLLRLLKHPDIVEIKHIMLPSDPNTFKDLYVCFELMESDLHTVIGANDDLTADHHKVFLYQLLRGLNFMHSNGVLHRDLKPKNILANSNCKLKICDFGLARPNVAANAAPLSPVYWTDYVATRWYRAPELCGCFYGQYTSAVDMWSIGCIFAEVLLGKPLFPGRDAVSQLQLITDLLGKPPPAVIDSITNPKAKEFFGKMPPKDSRPLSSKFPSADPLALDLLGRLLSFDPNKRPTAAEALAHRYFANLPNAVHQEAVPIVANFDFEHSTKLTELSVRHLIYREALQYHPQIMAAFEAACRAAAAAQQQQRGAQHDCFDMRLPCNANNPYTLAVSTPDNVAHQFRMQLQQYHSDSQDSGCSGDGEVTIGTQPPPPPPPPPGFAHAMYGGPSTQPGAIWRAHAHAGGLVKQSQPMVQPSFPDIPSQSHFHHHPQQHFPATLMGGVAYHRPAPQQPQNQQRTTPKYASGPSYGMIGPAFYPLVHPHCS